MNNNLDFLIRKNKGKQKLAAYLKLFIVSGFQERDLKHIKLEDSDQIIEEIRFLFLDIQENLEVLPGDDLNFEESKLLYQTYMLKSEDSKCYIFTDEYEFCGMYLVNEKTCISNALQLTKNSPQNTTFLLDHNFQYWYTINYYDIEDNNQPNMFEIQRKIRSEN